MGPFTTFENRTWIRAVLEMKTALAVGSRLSLEPVGTDMPVMKDAWGRPFIPGSSLKGAIRAQAERILRAIDRRPQLWACDPFGAPCVDSLERDKLWRDFGGDDARFSDAVFEQSCTACRLFGSPWFAGRVAFKDAYLINLEDLPIVYQIRDGVGIDRDLGAARAGIKYDFETVVPGACFQIEILAENLEDWEIGFLHAVLNLWSEGGIAVGGKSTRGLGWGMLRDLTFQRVEPANLLAYLQNREIPPSADWGRFAEAFVKKLKEVGYA